MGAAESVSGAPNDDTDTTPLVQSSSDDEWEDIAIDGDSTSPTEIDAAAVPPSDKSADSSSDGGSDSDEDSAGSGDNAPFSEYMSHARHRLGITRRDEGRARYPAYYAQNDHPNYQRFGEMWRASDMDAFVDSKGREYILLDPARNKYAVRLRRNVPTLLPTEGIVHLQSVHGPHRDRRARITGSFFYARHRTGHMYATAPRQ